MLRAIFGDNSFEAWTPVHMGGWGLTTKGNPSGKNGYVYYMSKRPVDSVGFIDIDTMIHHTSHDVVDYFRDNVKMPNIFYGNWGAINQAVEKYKQNPATFSENIGCWFKKLGGKLGTDWYNSCIDQYNRNQDKKSSGSYDYFVYRSIYG